MNKNVLATLIEKKTVEWINRCRRNPTQIIYFVGIKSGRIFDVTFLFDSHGRGNMKASYGDVHYLWFVPLFSSYNMS